MANFLSKLANKGAVNDIARHGGFGLFGKLLSKKRKEDLRPQISGGPVADGSTDRVGMGDSNRMVSKAKGGSVKKMAKGGSTASKRADGCATKGKTKGRFV